MLSEITRRGTLSLCAGDRRLLLIGLDLLAVNAALLFALALYPEYSLDWRLAAEHPSWFLNLNILWFLFAYAFDAYDLRTAGRMATAAHSVIKPAVLATVIYMLVPLWTPPIPSSLLRLTLFPTLLIGLLLAGRALYALVLRRAFFRRRAVIVGAGQAGRVILEALHEHGDGTFDIAGFVDDDLEKQGTVIRINVRGKQSGGSGGELGGMSEGLGVRSECSGDSGQLSAVRDYWLPVSTQGSLFGGEGSGVRGEGSGVSVPVLGDCVALKKDLVALYGISTIIVAIKDEVRQESLEALMDCLELGVEIIPMVKLYERLTGRVPIEYVGGSWSVAMPVAHPGTRVLNDAVKRVADLLLASFGLICFGLALPFIALAIYLESPGPIFFSQERVGKGGRRFRAYKLRSMMPDAEKDGPVWAQKNDGRVTRVGRILRATHVDEFPQFINILKGEMSVVGPRAERPVFVEELTRAIPFYRVRHAVRPGMAGWGLVKQGYCASNEDALLRVEYDLYYIKHQSLWLDLVILLKTIVNTVTFKGR